MSFAAKARSALLQEDAAVVVTVTRTQGSVPRETGTQMLVTAHGMLGSVGGGTLEWRAMAEAQGMLARLQNFKTSSFTLGPDLGQCCGGAVELQMQRYEQSQVDVMTAALQKPERRRHLLLFGAGHVGRALVLVLAQSRFDILWVDPRPLAFPGAHPDNVVIDNREDALLSLGTAPSGSLALVMSHSHGLDFAIVDSALRLPAIARIGLIGSSSKRGRFLSRLRQSGHSEVRLEDLICPLGNGEIRSKEPHSIAISTAQQFMALDEMLALAQTGQAIENRESQGISWGKVS